METFSLLKYWRGGGGGGSGTAASAVTSSPSTTTISTTVLSPTVSSVSDSDEEGSFFDLEFAVQEETELASSVLSSTCGGGDDDGEVIGGSEPNSPSGGDVWGNSIVISADPDGARALPQFPVSLLKSATKIRVFLLGLKKPRSGPAAADQTTVSSAVVSPKSKFLVVSLFSRDSKQSKSSKEDAAAAAVSAEERKFAKEVVLKYLNKIRPLYVRVSKRYGEKLRFATSEGEETDAETEIVLPAQASATPGKDPPPPPPPVVEPVHVVACGVRAPRASVPAGLKEVCKRLGKSRSASAAVVVKAAAAEAAVPPQRRDDSLIQQQDGIQSAIAHCKRSFNSSSSSSSSSPSIGSESPLQRSMSDPGDGRLEIAAAEKSA